MAPRRLSFSYPGSREKSSFRRSSRMHDAASSFVSSFFHFLFPSSFKPTIYFLQSESNGQGRGKVKGRCHQEEIKVKGEKKELTFSLRCCRRLSFFFCDCLMGYLPCSDRVVMHAVSHEDLRLLSFVTDGYSSLTLFHSFFLINSFSM